MLRNLYKYIPLKLLVMHVIFLVLFCVFWVTILHSSYKAGYYATQNNSYFGAMFLSVIIFLPVAFVCLITYLVVLCKSKIKGIFPLTLLFAMSLLIVFLTSVLVPTGPANGYYDYVKTNVDVNAIHQWLIDYEFNKYDEPQFGNVFEDNWPECIKMLNPRNLKIYEIDSVRYVRIIYFFGPSAAFGLCVMEKPMSIPPYDPDYSDTRIELSNDAFVWYN